MGKEGIHTQAPGVTVWQCERGWAGQTMAVGAVAGKHWPFET